jgi:hypothetical protein
MLTITLGLLAAFAAIIALPWLCSLMVRSLVRHWCDAPPGGSSYNPLLELVQPQSRHVIEVHEQVQKQDDSGSPPEP